MRAHERVGILKATRAGIIAAVAMMNLLCWRGFLLREPIPDAVLTSWDVEEALGYHSNVIAKPLGLVASRPVTARGYWGLDGGESPATQMYIYGSFPGLAGGALLNRFVAEKLAPRNPLLNRFVWRSNTRRSWLLAAFLFAGATVWWSIVGIAFGSLWRVGAKSLNGRHDAKR
jgi:hypothetical protein